MKYKDLDDKCYGVAGMAMGITLLEGDSLFAGVTLDAEGMDCIQFTQDYYFSGNPRVPASDSWHTMVAHYQLSVGVAIANALCRKMIGENAAIDHTLREKLLEAARADGMEMCNLDDDEVDPIFDKAFGYLQRAFGNRDVRRGVEAIVGALKEQHTLSRAEVTELLSEQ